jgi:hypothetical protein
MTEHEACEKPPRPVTLPYERRCRRCKRRPPDQWWTICPLCLPDLSGFGGSYPWLTPDVLLLAGRAYEGRGRKLCEVCKGVGEWISGGWQACSRCGGTGTIGDGTLDPLTLLALADALEESGCPSEGPCQTCDGKQYVPSEARGVRLCPDCKGERVAPHPLLAHLRSAGPHVKGCWAVDIILGKG